MRDDEEKFGGEKLGTFTITPDGDRTEIQAQVDMQPSSNNKMFEGWLVDDASEYRLSIG